MYCTKRMIMCIYVDGEAGECWASGGLCIYDDCDSYTPYFNEA